jgi:hypothetical protein
MSTDLLYIGFAPLVAAVLTGLAVVAIWLALAPASPGKG